MHPKFFCMKNFLLFVIFALSLSTIPSTAQTKKPQTKKETKAKIVSVCAIRISYAYHTSNSCAGLNRCIIPRSMHNTVSLINKLNADSQVTLLNEKINFYEQNILLQMRDRFGIAYGNAKPDSIILCKSSH